MSPSRKRRFCLSTANSGENSIRRQRKTAHLSLRKTRARASLDPSSELVNLTTKDLNHRRAVWETLSDLFLDTDDSLAPSSRIGVLAASPYSLDELEKILIDEVYLVCRPNLSSVAGEWTGFDPQWPEARILRRLQSPFRSFRSFHFGRLSVPRWTEWLETKNAIQQQRS